MNFENINTLRKVKGLEGKRVLVRLDFNVPIVDGKVRDDFRIRKILPTIDFLRKKNCKVILLAHIKSPATDSLRIVHDYLKTHFNSIFFENYLEDDAVRITHNFRPGDVALCENLRLHSGEETNDKSFSQKLSLLGDIYVNEAFSVSHRKHASIVGIPEFLPSYAGLLFEEEVKNLSFFFNPPRPFLFILGGAKFETKLPVIDKFMDIADHVFVGGALANDFFKQQGLEIGLSLSSKNDLDLNKFLLGNKLILPTDVSGKDQAGKTFTKPLEEIGAEDKILDVGPKTVTRLSSLAEQAQGILWNGPLGDYENGFGRATEDLATAIASFKAYSLVGGGDTVAAISNLGLEKDFGFVSTGGGAMLDFLSGETLPGLEALATGRQGE